MFWKKPDKFIALPDLIVRWFRFSIAGRRICFKTITQLVDNKRLKLYIGVSWYPHSGEKKWTIKRYISGEKYTSSSENIFFDMAQVEALEKGFAPVPSEECKALVEFGIETYAQVEELRRIDRRINRAEPDTAALAEAEPQDSAHHDVPGPAPKPVRQSGSNKQTDKINATTAECHIVIGTLLKGYHLNENSKINRDGFTVAVQEAMTNKGNTNLFHLTTAKNIFDNSPGLNSVKTRRGRRQT